MGANSRALLHQADEVLLYVPGPDPDEFVQTFLIAGEQGACRLLEIGQVSGHRRDETVKPKSIITG